MKFITTLSKNLMDKLTQMRSNHAPLNQFPFNMGQVTKPDWEKIAWKLPFLCHCYTQQQDQLVDELTTIILPHDTAILHSSKAFKVTAKYYNGTWRFKTAGSEHDSQMCYSLLNYLLLSSSPTSPLSLIMIYYQRSKRP